MTDITLTRNLVKQYDRLQNIREEWCRLQVSDAKADKIDETIVLNGKRFDSVPGFYLALGEAVNGTGGYFGACLDSLSDCLCGGFGLALPVTIEIFNFQTARERLGPKAITAWDLLRHRRMSINNMTDQEIAASLSIETSQNYFDLVLEVFKDAGVRINFHDE